MPTLLANKRMAPALRAPIEKSVTGRSGPRSRPSRFRAVMRLLFSVSVLTLAIWTFAHNRVAARELERRRATLVAELERQSATLDARQRGAVGADETFLRDLAGTFEGELVPPDWRAALTQPLVSVRGPVEAFETDASIEKAAAASTDEAFVRCLLDPPASRKEHDVFTKVRAAYSADKPLPNVNRLNDVQVCRTIVTPSSPPRRFGSRASASSVADALANSMSNTASREHVATARSSAGSVKTT